LKLPVSIPDAPQPIQANQENLSVGKRVCFTGEAFGKFVSADIKRWAVVVKASGTKLD